METVVGVFNSRDEAERAVWHLLNNGFEDINLLIPGAGGEQMNAIPTATTEQPGMGKALGGLVGGALGLAGGLELGTLAATGMMTGVGPVVAVGLAAAAVLGAAGSLVGAAGGAALEETVAGLPVDEVYVYKDALRKGRTVVFLESNNDHPAEQLRKTLKQAGAESIDVAREAWWIGLRSAEREHYQVSGGDFEQDESAYRAGFEAAVHHREPKRVRAAIVKHKTGTEQEAFRIGYERGRAHRAIYPPRSKDIETDEEFRKADAATDEASDESFPASDPPSH